MMSISNMAMDLFGVAAFSLEIAIFSSFFFSFSKSTSAFNHVELEEKKIKNSDVE